MGINLDDVWVAEDIIDTDYKEFTKIYHVSKYTRPSGNLSDVCPSTIVWCVYCKNGCKQKFTYLTKTVFCQNPHLSWQQCKPLSQVEARRLPLRTRLADGTLQMMKCGAKLKNQEDNVNIDEHIPSANIASLLELFQNGDDGAVMSIGFSFPSVHLAAIRTLRPCMMYCHSKTELDTILQYYHLQYICNTVEPQIYHTWLTIQAEAYSSMVYFFSWGGGGGVMEFAT